MNYVSAKIAKETLKISGNTLKIWKDNGKIKTKILSKKKILYDIDSILNNIPNNIDDRQNVIYARVSSTS
jgi:predicted site-specific integrase-resolvase